MCDQAGQPSTVTEALAMLDRALDHLNAADPASLPAGVQAQALRVLERAGAKHLAARARVLGAFAGQAAYQDDGQGSARAWLRWQTRVTTGAAAGAVGWARRIATHPVIGQALAAGDLSESWARQVCDWTRQLPPAQQDDADEILVGAARAGVDLDGLAGLAQEMFERSRQDRPDADGVSFGDRFFRLGVTFRGAGRAEGDLTPGCAAALDTVLESLGKKAGPEDRRTADQRRHDALEEACQRLIKGGMLPGRTRQPAHVSLHMTLSQLRGMPGASQVEAAWAAARASQPGWLTGPEADASACDARLAPMVTGLVDCAALDRMTGLYLAAHGLSAGEPGDLHADWSPGQAPAPDIIGIPGNAGSPDDSGIPGHAGSLNGSGSPGRGGSPDDGGTPGDNLAPDGSGLPGRAAAVGHDQPGRLAPASGHARTGDHDVPAGGGAVAHAETGPGQPSPYDGTPPGAEPSSGAQPTGPPRTTATKARQTSTATARPGACACTCGRCTCPARTPLSPATLARLRQTMLHLAADVMSGPTGLAAALRTALCPSGPEGSRSLPLKIPIPLDTGQATPTVPANLIRAVLGRHRTCAFPGCRVPVSQCEIHHLIPRSGGGPTALWNLAPVCPFHHLTVIHRWGWSLRLHPDGTTTATSPNGRTLHDHDPPSQNPPSPAASHAPPSPAASQDPPSHAPFGHAPFGQNHPAKTYQVQPPAKTHPATSHPARTHQALPSAEAYQANPPAKTHRARPPSRASAQF